MLMSGNGPSRPIAATKQNGRITVTQDTGRADIGTGREQSGGLMRGLKRLVAAALMAASAVTLAGVVHAQNVQAAGTIVAHFYTQSNPRLPP